MNRSHDISKELLAGSIGGMANITVCHPMDTIRTRLQTSTVVQLKGPMDAIRQLIRNEGLLAFYKGFSAPFVAQSVYKSVIFTTNAVSKRYILPNAEESPYYASKLLKIFLCGTIGGSVNSVIVTPVELIRNKLITQELSKKGSRIYKGPLEILSSIRADSGGSFAKSLQRLYTGLHVTALRDGGGMGFYFLGFELATKALKANDQLSLASLVFSGGVAGMFFWIYALPFDYIKTKIQMASFEKGNENVSLVSIFKEYVTLILFFLYFYIFFRTHLKDLYRGWQVALGRGIPGAASTLTVYTLVRNKLEGETMP